MSHATARPIVPAVITLAAALVAAVPAARATTWLVEADGSGQAPTIAAAIQIASPGDTVDVGCGTYFEAGINMKDGVVLTSRTGTPDCVTIDGQGMDSVLRFRGVDALARVIGFTITGGASAFGGGIDCASGSYPTLEDCIITGNTAGEGGGMFAVHASPTLRRCRIEGNAATRWGGGLSCYDNASPVLEDCAILGNSAGEFGGGIWTYFFASPRLTNCVIAGNSADNTGGGMFLFESMSTIENCTITANESDRGGGIALERSTPTIRNTILRGDCAADGRELAFLSNESTADFGCSNVDTTSGWLDGPNAVVISGELYGDDPHFCAPVACSSDLPDGGAEFALQASSPCLPANNGCGVLIGAQGAACAGSTSSPIVTRVGAGPDFRSWPNPFVDDTRIAYSIPQAAAVDLRVFDAAGRLVRALENGAVREAGAHQASWDGRDSKGRTVAAGVYFAQLEAGSRRSVQRMVRLR